MRGKKSVNVQKLIIVLLIIAIIFSSIAVVLTFMSPGFKSIADSSLEKGSNNGNVNLYIEENPRNLGEEYEN